MNSSRMVQSIIQLCSCATPSDARMDPHAGVREGPPGAGGAGRVRRAMATPRSRSPTSRAPPTRPRGRSTTTSRASSACTRSCARTWSGASSTASRARWRSAPSRADALVVGFDYAARAGFVRMLSEPHPDGRADPVAALLTERLAAHRSRSARCSQPHGAPRSPRRRAERRGEASASRRPLACALGSGALRSVSPPATAGRIVTSSPSATGVARPSRKRMSSPLR